MTKPVEVVRSEARELAGGPRDFDSLLASIGEARFVLLGEASHGTHEFYRMRADITRRLIVEKGFRAVAVEGDWPSAYRVNRFVRGDASIADAEEALEEFRRFPTWMWRNADVLDFLGWLRESNDARAEAGRAGFYGLDLYSLHESVEAVLAYLDRTDPAAAARARQRYACFDRFDGDPQAYGYGAASGTAESCESEVVQQLVELRRKALDASLETDRAARAEFFQAEQNARLVKNAEEYYRAMFRGGAASWNLRDRHMTETLEALAAFLDAGGAPSKIVVWAHNSHLGDARATQMGQSGELNVGQLVRERHGQSTFSLGFTTHHGTVTAASDWDAPAERKRVRPALDGSFEALFHDVGVERFLLLLSRGSAAARALREPRLERAIGVIYRPETERQSHYFFAQLPEQFDGVIHCDASRAVEPLERFAPVPADELPETYPWGI
jgi:erythromycin esterase-like protein